ncbi:SAM-dependent methyltransferase, partial [Pseudomonas sp. MWU12-2115]
MSKEVDWERDDLFHVPVTQLTHFLSRELSRHYVVRHDYGLYEYTTFVYREHN